MRTGLRRGWGRGREGWVGVEEKVRLWFRRRLRLVLRRG
jgi:hypothetical protein